MKLQKPIDEVVEEYDIEKRQVIKHECTGDRYE